MPLPKCMCWNLIPEVIVLGDEAVGKRSGHEGGTLMIEITTLLKDSPEIPLTPCEDTARR